MKILLDHTLPFALAHGGAQTQIEMTKRAVERAGLEVEWLRWWDDQQRGDLIHLFAPAELGMLGLARFKKIPVVLTTLLNGECNFSPAQRRAKRWKIATLGKIPGFRGVNGLLPWQAFHLCTMNAVSLNSEVEVLREVYRVPADRVAQVPYGLSDIYLQATAGPRQGDFLISTATITERKRSVELAQLARRAEVPILFVGKPYHEDDPYWKEFQGLIDDRWVRYRPHVGNEAAMVELYRSARGFVLASVTENWCLSAHEAAACGLPCLLRPQNWARERFGSEAHYFPENPEGDLEALRRFHAAAPTLPAPRVRQWSWWEVGEQMAAVYQRLVPGA